MVRAIAIPLRGTTKRPSALGRAGHSPISSPTLLSFLASRTNTLAMIVQSLPSAPSSEKRASYTHT